ncbi:hypothetical protein Y032_0002g774 [Ancylostoma ceylanicum]|uniref:Uncharacterized protein n=1 Tax=Ancylostoma ceylanicum TaxID=53326 RepID=A0A016W272_9BILA|nr:hypothetical protein Y032_0002g774 [Ancylostoma ceylanicum]
MNQIPGQCLRITPLQTTRQILRSLLFEGWRRYSGTIEFIGHCSEQTGEGVLDHLRCRFSKCLTTLAQALHSFFQLLTIVSVDFSNGFH